MHEKKCNCLNCNDLRKKPFVSLHGHLSYSLLDGAGNIDDFVKLAKEFQHPAITVLDHGNMSGTFEFYQKCKAAGIKPILGMEAYVNDKMDKEDEKKYEGKDTHQSILIKNKEGYASLNKLTYLSFTEGYYRRGRITTEWLIENKNGLLLTTSCCASEMARLIEEGKEREAEERLKLLMREFGDDLVAELQFNEYAPQKAYNNFILRMVKKYSLMPILTGDVHYAYPEDNRLQDVLIAINQKKVVGDPGTFSLQTRHLHYHNCADYHWMNKEFGFNYPEHFVNMCLENTLKVADKCNFDFETDVDKTPKYIPTTDVVEFFKTKDTKEIITRLAHVKLKQKLNKYKENKVVIITPEKEKEYIDRLNFELKVISDKNVLDYFMVTWELINFCKKDGIATGPGRGCFLPFNKVMKTSDIFAYIKDIKIGDIIIDAFGNNRKVTDVLEYDINENVIELEFDKYKKITCTLDHEILTNNRGWVAAKFLNKNDEIIDVQLNEVRKLTNTVIYNYIGKVYDLTIEISHSYNIEGIGVHNSAAGSLLSWCIDITKIDSLRFGLYFERFLNPYRAGLPDIDIDYESDTDDRTLNFLYGKYGKERVFPVITFGRFNEKGCIKDVTKALGYDSGFDSDIFAVTKEMPNKPVWDISLKEWLNTWHSDPACSDRVRSWLLNPEYDEIRQLTLKLQGQVRNWGKHAAGIVITPGPVWETMPVNITKGTVVTGFQESGNNKDLSTLGILKLDRLNLETLNIIKDAIFYIKEHHDIDIQEKIDYVDLYDKNLYDELRLGNNQGIFQFESPGISSLAKDIKVENFDEIVAVTSLWRPGPLGVGAHTEYAKNKFHPEGRIYPHPLLKNILDKTNGVLIFQEQLMFICNEIAGMTLGEGDMLRKYMDSASKIIAKTLRGETLDEKEFTNKNYQGYLKYWKQFLEGAKKSGLSDKDVKTIEEYLIKYLGYSFNKCLSKNNIVISETRGKIKIDQVEIGEKILCFNPKTLKDEFNVIKNIHHNGIKKVYRIYTEVNSELECTLDHKIMTRNGMKTLSEIIKKNYKIKTKYRGPKSIIKFEEAGNTETIDLEIDSEFHNFYANDICVSNSHSVSYSYLTAQTLFLKHYYPTEFYAALLNHTKKFTDKDKEEQWLKSSILAAMIKGIDILPPRRDSNWEWTIVGDKQIAMGFSAINGMGIIAYNELQDKKIKELNKEEFFNKNFSKFNKGSFEACLKAGIFDDWSNSRDEIKEMRGIKIKDVQQLDIFGNYGIAAKMPNKRYLPTTGEQKEQEFLEVCKLDLKFLQKICTIKAEFLKEYGVNIEPFTNFEDDKNYYYFYLHTIKIEHTKNGKQYYRLTISDGANKKSLNMWEAMYKSLSNYIEVNNFYVTKFMKDDRGWLNFNAAADFRKVF